LRGFRGEIDKGRIYFMFRKEEGNAVIKISLLTNERMRNDFVLK